MYCELLLARIGLLEGRECDPGLEEAVRSLIYAAPRSEVKELVILRQIFAHRYGKQFEQDSSENKDDCVNAKVVLKLGVAPPAQELVERYLKEIARTYRVSWPGAEDDSDDNDTTTAAPGSGGDSVGPPSGGIAELEQPLPSTPAKQSLQIVNVALPSPTSENPRPRLHIPPDAVKNSQAAKASADPPRPKPEVAAAASAGREEDDNSFEAIMARFEKLKRG